MIEKMDEPVHITQTKSVSGFGIAALVLGIVACLGCWIPTFGILTIPSALLGILFGFIGMLSAKLTNKSYVGLPVAGTIVSITAVSVVIAINGLPGFLKSSSTASSIGNSSNTIVEDSERSKTATMQRSEGALERCREQLVTKIAEIKAEIAELETKRAKAEQDKESRRQFTIILSQFSARESSYQENVYQIELTVKNGTKHAISKVKFQCVFASPERSVPWVRAHLPHDIPGGLEPGERATWDIGAYEFEDIPKERDGIVLTVTPIDIYGADGKPLFDFEFSQRDEMRLEELSQRLEKLKKNLIN